MSLDTLLLNYERARESNEFDDHAAFVQELLTQRDRSAIEFHYHLLRDHRNKDLYLRIRLAMIKRAKSAQGFLLERAVLETDLSLRRDLLHILGRMRVPEALDMARMEIRAADSDMRHRACYVIGWMGNASDVPVLRAVLLGDSDGYVRRTAATSHSQMGDRLLDLQISLLLNLRDALAHEKNEEVVKWIVVTAQYLSKKRFGLHENVDEAVVEGDLSSARSRCIAYLAELP